MRARRRPRSAGGWASASRRYRWKGKFGGMDVSDAKRLKQLEDENRRLQQMVAEQALELQAAKLVL